MARRSPLRILIVEDNAINQQLAVALLDRLGYRADVAGNGIEALEALDRQQYDVVLMDIQMPEMDGLEATRQIHRRCRADERPRIIAVTANVRSADRERFLAEGMDDYLGKPINVDELVAALEKVQALADRRTTPDETIDATEVAEAASPSGRSPAGAGSAADAGELDETALNALETTLGQKAQLMLPALIDRFFLEAPKLLDAAQAALNEGRVADLRRAAHTLKSNAATFGATALSALARQLEGRAKEGDLEPLETLTDLIDAARKTFVKAKGALETWLAVKTQPD